MGLTKGYSLAIVPQFILLVIPENKRKKIQTHWFHSIFESLRSIISLLKLNLFYLNVGAMDY